MALMTQKEYAKKKGVTPQYINKLVNQGKIVRVGKKVDPRQADAAIAAFARAGKVIKGSRKSKTPTSRSARNGAPGKTAARAPRQPSGPKPPRESASKSLTEARAMRENYQALQAKLAYEQTMGSLLPREQVLVAEQKKNANIRAQLRRLPRSLAPMLARCTSPAEVEHMLLGEIDIVLEQLARDPLGFSGGLADGSADVVAPPVVHAESVQASAAGAV